MNWRTNWGSDAVTAWLRWKSYLQQKHEIVSKTVQFKTVSYLCRSVCSTLPSLHRCWIFSQVFILIIFIKFSSFHIVILISNITFIYVPCHHCSWILLSHCHIDHIDQHIAQYSVFVYVPCHHCCWILLASSQLCLGSSVLGGEPVLQIELKLFFC